MNPREQFCCQKPDRFACSVFFILYKMLRTGSDPSICRPDPSSRLDRLRSSHVASTVKLLIQFTIPGSLKRLGINFQTLIEYISTFQSGIEAQSARVNFQTLNIFQHSRLNHLLPDLSYSLSLEAFILKL